MTTNLFCKDKKGSVPTVHLLAQPFIGEMKFLWDSVHMAFKKGRKLSFYNLLPVRCCCSNLKQSHAGENGGLT